MFSRNIHCWQISNVISVLQIIMKSLHIDTAVYSRIMMEMSASRSSSNLTTSSVPAIGELHS